MKLVISTLVTAMLAGCATPPADVQNEEPNPSQPHSEPRTTTDSDVTIDNPSISASSARAESKSDPPSHVEARVWDLHSLERFHTYRYEGSAPLMPRRQPTARPMTKIEPGTLLVVERVHGTDTKWYGVACYSADHAYLDHGWVNGIALMRGELYDTGAAPDEIDLTYQRVGSVENFDFAGTKRRRIRIIVDPSRGASALRATLRRAAFDLYSTTAAALDAIDVIAYAPGDDTSSSWTVGQATFAPGGEWADAGEPGRLSMNVVLGLQFRDD